ncbi:MAG: biopolymer transporter ExbD [Rhodobacteraceae bacterium]|nr:biopolymer transporter ExbD [Paracoccaceae bacterium]
MNFRKTSYGSEKENIVPMINIVFLLLIFFLITSSLVPRPVEIIDRPFGLSDSKANDPNYLFITSSSEVMYLGQTGETAWELIKKSEHTTLTIEADRNLAANKLISLLNKLDSMNITQLEVIVNDPINERQR